MATDPWIGISPAQAVVECGGRQHRLRWEAGSLRSLDHDDPDGERALAALGGERCTCIDLLDAWSRHDEDPRVLVLARRGPLDVLVAQPDATRRLGAVQVGARQAANAQLGRARAQAALRGQPVRARATMAGAAPMFRGGAAMVSIGSRSATGGRSSAGATSENELIELLGLGGGLPDRLVATVAATWRERIVQHDRAVTRIRPQLHAALHGRVLATLHAWFGTQRAIKLGLRMIGEQRRPSLGHEDGVIAAEIPFGWLLNVWARDLQTIMGRFCLAAETGDGRTWQLRMVGPDLGTEHSVTMALGDL